MKWAQTNWKYFFSVRETELHSPMVKLSLMLHCALVYLKERAQPRFYAFICKTVNKYLKICRSYMAEGQLFPIYNLSVEIIYLLIQNPMILFKMYIRLQFEDVGKRSTHCDYKKGLKMKRENESFSQSKQIWPKGLARVSAHTFQLRIFSCNNFLDN